MAGNYKVAAAASTTLQSQAVDYLGIKDALGNYVQYVYMQPTFTAMRFGKWDDILKAKPVDTLIYASLLQYFAKGMAYCSKGKPVLANLELKKLNLKIQDKSLKPNMDNFSSAYEAASIARLILMGSIAGAQKQYPAAIDFLQKAVKAEDHIIYNEPRDWPLPARQYLGDALIKAGRHNEAIGVLNKDLFINPNNGWALTGLQLAYERTNNSIELEKVRQQLKHAWEIKDVVVDRPVF